MCVMCKAAKAATVDSYTFGTAIHVWEQGKPDYSMISFYQYVGMTTKQIRKLRQCRYKRIRVSYHTAKKIAFLASIYEHPHQQTLLKAYEAREQP